MKIVQILGGLGNQMFQYAFLIALREKFKQEVLMDASLFDTYPLHNGFELDRVFKITTRKATNKEVHKLYWPFFTHSYFMSRIYRHYFPVLKTELRELEHCPYMERVLSDESDLYYVGEFQNHKYFDWCKEAVVKEFSWKEVLDGRNEELAQKLCNSISCSIHVRRGDYLKDPNFLGICELGYYEKAIEYVKGKYGEKVEFAIFSNDTEWCNQNIIPLLGNSNAILVDWNTGQRSSVDMRLMSLCKINIIANSSFSWWAAYLNNNRDCEVIAPEVWMHSDVWFSWQLPSWKLINS